MSPLVGSSSPAMARSSVVLPLPLPATSPTRSPSPMTRLRSEKSGVGGGEAEGVEADRAHVGRLWSIGRPRRARRRHGRTRERKMPEGPARSALQRYAAGPEQGHAYGGISRRTIMAEPITPAACAAQLSGDEEEQHRASNDRRAGGAKDGQAGTQNLKIRPAATPDAGLEWRADTGRTRSRAGAHTATPHTKTVCRTFYQGALKEVLPTPQAKVKRAAPIWGSRTRSTAASKTKIPARGDSGRDASRDANEN